MSTEKIAGTETAGGSPLQTVGEAFDRSARSSVLMDFAKEVLGTAKPDGEAAEAKAEIADAESGNAEAEANTEGAEAEEQALSQGAEGEAEAEAAAEPEATTEDEGQDDTLGELRAKLDENTQHAINKRIGKEVAKTKAEREAREQAEAKLAELNARLADWEAKAETTAEPTATRRPVPLEQVNDAKAVAKVEQQAREAKRQAQDLLDQLDDAPHEVGAVLRQANLIGEESSVSDMRRVLRSTLRNAERTLLEDIPARVEYLKAADKAANEAMEWMPELKDRTSPRTAKFNQVLRELPELKQRPDWPIAAGLYVLGLEAFEAMKAKKTAPAAKPVAKREKPVVIPKPAGAVPTKAPPQSGPGIEAVDELIAGNKSARQKYLQQLVRENRLTG
jgi:hypothetical protein